MLKLYITSYFNFTCLYNSVLCCDNTAEGVLDSTKKISWHLLRLLGFCWLKNWKWNVASRPQRLLLLMRESAHNHVNWTWYDRCCESVNRTRANLRNPGFRDTYTANILFWRLGRVIYPSTRCVNVNVEDGKLERNAAGALFKDITFICYVVRNPDWDLIYASRLQFRN